MTGHCAATGTGTPVTSGAGGLADLPAWSADSHRVTRYATTTPMIVSGSAPEPVLAVSSVAITHDDSLLPEAMAQVAGVLVAKLAPHTRGKIMFLASVEEAKFRRPVVPGDQLRIEMKMVRLKTTIAKMQGLATVDGQVVAEATLMCKLTDQLAATQPAAEVPEPQMA